MFSTDVVVLGAGISGASYAHHARRAGDRVLVLEKGERVGGCLASVAGPDDFWFELGAHTCYASYCALLEMLEEIGLGGELLERGKPVLRFLSGDDLSRGKNLGALLGQAGKLELVTALLRWPAALRARKSSESVRTYYSRFVGARNYERVLGPMLSAVPSQRADDFPAEMLFKKRERREDVPRSFTLRGGLRSAVEALLSQPGVDVRTGVAATGVQHNGDGLNVLLAGGERVRAREVAVALPPPAATRVLADSFPELSREISGISAATVVSLGCAVRADRVRLPYSTFLIPRDDVFHSVVTRDVVAHPTWRGFTFHFQPRTTAEERIERVTHVLGVERVDLQAVVEHTHVLPSPVLGHAQRVERIDELIVDEPLALTGNWFAGLSIEDCVRRSRSEHARLSAARPAGSGKTPTPTST